MQQGEEEEEEEEEEEIKTMQELDRN